jgi:hypothetical protein
MTVSAVMIATSPKVGITILAATWNAARAVQDS